MAIVISPDSHNEDDFNPEPQQPLSFFQRHLSTIVWTTWGTLMAALIGWLDRKPVSAILWFMVGIMIGTIGKILFDQLLPPFLMWYERRFESDKQRMTELMLFQAGQVETDEFREAIDEHLFHVHVAIAPLFGIIHGLLWGGFAGIAFASEWYTEASATLAALVGIAIGPIVVSILAAIVMSLLLPIPRSIRVKTRIARRAQILASPFYAIPACWFCMKAMCTNSVSETTTDCT